MTESLEIIPYLASPEVGEVSRSDGEVLRFASFSRYFQVTVLPKEENPSFLCAGHCLLNSQYRRL